MKKTITLTVVSAMVVSLLASCAMVSEKLATPENIAKLPEPLKSTVIQLRNEQKAVEARYTQGTKTMLKAYSTIAEAIGLKKESAVLKAQADTLNSGSSMNDARKAMSQSKAAISAVRDKISKSKGVKVESANKFAQGVQIKNQAYMVQFQLATDASLKAANAVQKAQGASPFEMAVLTSQLDPLFFIARDVPKFLAQERAFNEACKEYAKEHKISLPPMDLPTPKLQMSF